MSHGRRFPPDYSERVQLRDGSEVLLRLLRSEDRELLRAGFERLGPTSRYHRFFCAKNSLSESELSYLCDIDGDNHFAIGAVREHAEGEPEPLAIARFVRLGAEPEVAEAAIAVIDAMQGKGLGKVLLGRLAEAALERSVQRFRCGVLVENNILPQLLHELDPEACVVGLSHGVRQIELRLHTPTSASAADRFLHELERFMSHAARGLIHIRARRSHDEAPFAPED